MQQDCFSFRRPSPQPHIWRDRESLLGWKVDDEAQWSLWWGTIMIRPRWLDFSNVFPLTSWCEETRCGPDQLVQLMQEPGERMSCYQIPAPWFAECHVWSLQTSRYSLIIIIRLLQDTKYIANGFMILFITYPPFNPARRKGCSLHFSYMEIGLLWD